MQFQSDILGVTVERPMISETTALGAAYLAGLAAGYWNSVSEVANNWQVDRTFDAMIDDDHRDELYDGWKKAVKAARAFK